MLPCEILIYDILWLMDIPTNCEYYNNLWDVFQRSSFEELMDIKLYLTLTQTSFGGSGILPIGGLCGCYH